MEKAIWIKKEHTDYDGLKWVVRAVKTISDEGENILSHIEIMDHVATACDGNRLHEYTLNLPEDFPNGIYRPFAQKNNLIFILNAMEGITYPNTGSIFPTEGPVKKFQISMGKGALFDWAYTQVIRNIEESSTIQINFLEKMLVGAINWDISIYGEGNICLFMSPGKRGLIMPMH